MPYRTLVVLLALVATASAASAEWNPDKAPCPEGMACTMSEGDGAPREDPADGAGDPPAKESGASRFALAAVLLGGAGAVAAVGLARPAP